MMAQLRALAYDGAAMPPSTAAPSVARSVSGSSTGAAASAAPPEHASAYAAARTAEARPGAPPPLPSSLVVTAPRFRKDPRLAALYDSDIAPVWTQPFGRLLLQRVPVLGKATVLDVMCKSGYPGLEILRRCPEARVFAVDPSPPLLELARQKAGALVGKRVFFRTENAEPSLPFDEGFADLVVSNLGLVEVAQPRLLLAEMARVARPGATVLATLPLAGSFAELYALIEELFPEERYPREGARLRAHHAAWPTAESVRGLARAAGLSDISVEVAPFSLLFSGGADLFFSPVIEYGPLTAWKAILGDRGPEMQEAFNRLRDAIDAQRPRPFALTVRAACLSARRPAAAPSSPEGPGGDTPPSGRSPAFRPA